MLKYLALAGTPVAEDDNQPMRYHVTVQVVLLPIRIEESEMFSLKVQMR